MTDYRKVFDTIPEQFDRYRPRYCPELFSELISFAGIGPGKSVLELGPGTGQASGPVLDTGCDYHALELGEHLYAKMIEKFGSRPNFHIVNGDFVTYDFGGARFDMVYSAATIQWIPEEIAFRKTFDLLKPGGTLAMMLTKGDYRTPNEALYREIQKVYDSYYRPAAEYKNMKAPFDYTHATGYGFVGFEKREYHGRREFTADEYAAYCGTHSDHLVIPEPCRTPFFEGLRRCVREAGNRIVFNDTYVLYLCRKPE
ncbi:MAG: class I SAM-dependent methyltransferase [Clostridiales bacterium]|nr:class I SAM-dependent methyltransferase [Clostridiales bacterium]